MWYNQHEFDIRCEWGLKGVEILGPISDVIIIVDILSFTTSVEIATSRGAQVYPFESWNETAINFARDHNAKLATEDRHDNSGYSLSPQSLTSIAYGDKLVLPSPNGSMLSRATGGTPTIAACLRNCSAVAQHALQYGDKISVIPAGEKWKDGAFRPSWEDWIGAGAVIYHLMGNLLLSPESESAVAAFLAVKSHIAKYMAKCVSGQELIYRDLGTDLVLASEYNISECVPKMENDAYRDIYFEDTYAADRLDNLG